MLGCTTNRHRDPAYRFLAVVLLAGPNDPAASALAHRSLEQAAKRRSKAAAAAAGGDSAAAGGFEGLSEADQLALAIAMSVEVRCCAGEQMEAALLFYVADVSRKRQEDHWDAAGSLSVPIKMRTRHSTSSACMVCVSCCMCATC